MFKKNITTSQLQNWAVYSSQAAQSPDAAAGAIYKHANETVEESRKWYWKSIKAKKASALLVRIFTFAFLFAGTVLPVLAGDPAAERVRQLQFGVIALAAAGLLQLADKVFGWSSGWVRYITTVTPMEALATRFEMDWSGYMLSKSGSLETSDVGQLFPLAKKFVDDALKLQSDETDKWVAEFNNGTAALADAIRAGKEVAERTLDSSKTAAASAAQTGALQLTITKANADDQIAVSVDGEMPTPYAGSIWARTNVPLGVRLVQVLNLTTQAKSVVQALIVQPNAVTSATVAV
ncbi:SLATT domain-containing protein [Pseudoduganella sp. RAF19]|uniref:SLATT domain-containing protein n=1 Tax=Pseudoduganella sp. RAF19 TaxID=3233052 RepID=UPI003F99D709